MQMFPCPPSLQAKNVPLLGPSSAPRSGFQPHLSSSFSRSKEIARGYTLCFLNLISAYKIGDPEVILDIKQFQSLLAWLVVL